MDMKQAIEFLAGIEFTKYADRSLCMEFVKNIREIISMLQRCEKYERIVEDIEQYIIDWQTVDPNFCTTGNDIIDLIKWLKRKYFPKNSDKELSELVDRVKKVINETAFTCEEIAERLTPKGAIK